MKRWKLEIQLKSDLCTATGENEPGIINLKTALENGIPYIPAKRIKGCLLEAGKELCENNGIREECLERIFGKSGMKKGLGIYVEDAQLSFVPAALISNGRLPMEEEPLDETKAGMEKNSLKIQKKELSRKECDRLREEARNAAPEEKAYLEEILTRQRTRTAIDEDSGTAMEHSLRTMQVVPAGIRFESVIENLRDEDQEALEWCAKGLRHMGVGITRGFGEVACRLERLKEDQEMQKEEEEFQEFYSQAGSKAGNGKWMETSYELTLDMPVVLDGETDAIPGSQIQGAMAGIFPAEDQAGFEIFQKDGVQFGYGFLKNKEREYVPCPKGIAAKKNNEEDWFCIKNDPGERRRDIKGPVCLEEEKLYESPIKKEIHFHHARPKDRGIAHPLSDRAWDTSSPTGEFYQYTAISKGQTFVGTWRGTKENLLKLKEYLDGQKGKVRLGRSRTAEYGRCTIRLEKPKQKKEYRKASDWLLWLVSPLVSQEEETGSYTLEKNVFRKQLEEILPCAIKSFEEVAVSYLNYSGYNSQWRLPMPSYPAMAPGSTFYLKLEEEVEGNLIEGERFGELTGRGLGQVRVIPWDEELKGKRSLAPMEKEEQEGTESSLVKGLIEARRRQREQERAVQEEWTRRWENAALSGLPSSTAIQQLLQFVKEQLKKNQEGSDLYLQMEEAVKSLKKEDKKEKLYELILPCKGKGRSFILLYLEYAKWEVRRREGDE